MGKKELLRKPDILSCSFQYSFSKQTNTLIHQKRTLQNTLLNDFYFIIIHRDTLTYGNGLYSYLWKWPGVRCLSCPQRSSSHMASLKLANYWVGVLKLAKLGVYLETLEFSTKLRVFVIFIDEGWIGKTGFH